MSVGTLRELEVSFVGVGAGILLRFSTSESVTTFVVFPQRRLNQLGFYTIVQIISANPCNAAVM